MECGVEVDRSHHFTRKVIISRWILEGDSDRLDSRPTIIAKVVGVVLASRK